ncbi:DUF308 domain-containing protein [Phaeovibrio sulfidiphilus]|uniref:DUF308 domain-containing protein n=1 Tax=Phaeovibrio sulfidiphilus TaxID=1220600 RepID=A0A8J7CCS4_9PROT|nr:DUF308 domain-containing protein [Phaeovibrio sulfidiphilus]MBE1236049.1 DUF308 domain-containing protein [Phaeovibrio sulfidiphilus]
MTDVKSGGEDVMVVEFRRLLPREWKWIGLRGLLGVVFGLLLFLAPVPMSGVLFLVFAAFVFADGVIIAMTGWRMYTLGVPWWPYAISGATGILFGLLALLSPLMAATALKFVIAFWSIAAGLFLLRASGHLKGIVDTDTVMTVSGILAIVFGVLLCLVDTVASLVAMTLAVGMLSVTYGVLLMVLAWKLRSSSDSA